mmetsp:Transcript_19810/g.37277  ORF Transcript_19810/g.37277 Transcript_19810/m.37277 type:complete len:228 (-) Transcript_19810:386-1069(-)
MVQKTIASSSLDEPPLAAISLDLRSFGRNEEYTFSPLGSVHHVSISSGKLTQQMSGTEFHCRQGFQAHAKRINQFLLIFHLQVCDCHLIILQLVEILDILNRILPRIKLGVVELKDNLQKLFRVHYAEAPIALRLQNTSVHPMSPQGTLRQPFFCQHRGHSTRIGNVLHLAVAYDVEFRLLWDLSGVENNISARHQKCTHCLMADPHHHLRTLLYVLVEEGMHLQHR